MECLGVFFVSFRNMLLFLSENVSYMEKMSCSPFVKVTVKKVDIDFAFSCSLISESVSYLTWQRNIPHGR